MNKSTFTTCELVHRRAHAPPRSPFYEGVLSAAAIHGSSHQQPMVFQVVTSKPTREILVCKVTIQFSMNGKVEQITSTYQ